MKPDILFEDESIVIVSKPAGMLTIPDRFDKDFPNIRTFLINQYDEIFTVHRLDRDTSGVLVFAKNAEAHKHLSMQFEHQQVQKTYLAIVRGIISKDDQDIDIPLIADTRKKGLMRPSARGKESFTSVHVAQRFRMASLLECKPKTGRLHQIRVHLSAIGYPLLVDPDYGNNAEFKLSTIKKKFNVKKHQDLIETNGIYTHSFYKALKTLKEEMPELFVQDEEKKQEMYKEFVKIKSERKLRQLEKNYQKNNKECKNQLS